MEELKKPGKLKPEDFFNGEFARGATRPTTPALRARPSKRLQSMSATPRRHRWVHRRHGSDPDFIRHRGPAELLYLPSSTADALPVRVGAWSSIWQRTRADLAHQGQQGSPIEPWPTGANVPAVGRTRGAPGSHSLLRNGLLKAHAHGSSPNVVRRHLERARRSALRMGAVEFSRSRERSTASQACSPLRPLRHVSANSAVKSFLRQRKPRPTARMRGTNSQPGR